MHSLLLLFLMSKPLTGLVCKCSENPFCFGFGFGIDSSSEFGSDSRSDSRSEVLIRLELSTILTRDDEVWTRTGNGFDFPFKFKTSGTCRTSGTCWTCWIPFSSWSFSMRFSWELDISGFGIVFLEMKVVSRVPEVGGAPFNEFVLKSWTALNWKISNHKFVKLLKLLSYITKWHVWNT